MDKSFDIVRCEPDDVEAVLQNEEATFSEPMTHGQILADMARANHVILCAKSTQDGTCLGHAALSIVAGEGSLYTICVLPEHRGKKIGKVLLLALFERAKERGATQIYLEVRAGNEIAKALYESVGFYQIGVRKNFYKAPKENALVLCYDFLKKGE